MNRRLGRPVVFMGRTLAAWTGLLLIAGAGRLRPLGVILTPDAWQVLFYLAGALLLVVAIAPALDAQARAVVAAIVSVALCGRFVAELASVIQGRPFRSALLPLLLYPLLAGFVVYLMATWPKARVLPSER